MENLKAKESNFVSAVFYMKEDALRVQPFLQKLSAALAARFAHFEIIVVNDASHDDSVAQVKAFAAQSGTPVTLINMSLAQGTELCMNAGLDLSIGDFVFEFDTLDVTFDFALLDKAYDTALAGYDIVSVSPAKNRSVSSHLFYKIFNRYSNSHYPIGSDALRLLSRRSINRVHAVSATPAYRKAAYAASGLKQKTLHEESVALGTGAKQHLRLSLAVDSLALYTNAAYHFSFGVAMLMLVGTFAELVYALCIYLSGANPIEGWTTTMLVLTVGFFGVFAILSIVLKYLSLLVELVFKQQKYLVEGVEKLQ